MWGQWHLAGLNGTRFALNYAVLFARMDRLQQDGQPLTPERWNQLYADVRVCERAALEQIALNG